MDMIAELPGVAALPSGKVRERYVVDDDVLLLVMNAYHDVVPFTLPKVAVMRSFVMSHIIHHRGQLSVYLRLNDIAVPSIYGPSADEGQM